MSIAKELIRKRKKAKFSEQPDFPKVLMIEPSNICNHSCAFCGNKDSVIKRMNIPYDLAKRVIAEAAGLGVTDIGFYLRGEPFLHPQLADMVRYAKEQGINYVYISTNGTVGDDEAYSRVLDAGLDSVKLSINAGNREDYKLAHGKDQFDAAVRRLHWLIEHKKESAKDYKIFVSSIFTAQNHESIVSWGDEIAPNITEHYMHGVRAIPGDDSADLESHYMTLPCPMVFNRVHVTAEGYMNICCFDFENSLAVADLNKVSMLEAWNSPLFVEIRKKHINGDAAGTLCEQCVKGGLVSYEPLDCELTNRSIRNERG